MAAFNHDCLQRMHDCLQHMHDCPQAWASDRLVSLGARSVAGAVPSRWTAGAHRSRVIQ
jgi:hypothetical protein